MRGRDVSDGYWVRVPGSTSNLGPGFDVLGMAVDVFLEARYRPGPDPLVLLRSGTLAEISVDPSHDLVLEALLETYGLKSLPEMEMELRSETDVAQGDAPPGGVLEVHSRIPVGRGLGSSAAARIAGRVLGLLAVGRAVDGGAVVDWVAAREGHPDNAAPAITGGLVAARIAESGEVRCTDYPVSPRLGWVYAAPEAPLDTATARAALPETVPHGVAVRTAARMAFLLSALARGEGEVLAEAMDDELHVPYRLPLVPGGEAAALAGRAAGAWAVTLSGAGSGLIAVCPLKRVRPVREAMVRAFQRAPEAGGGFSLHLRPWQEGTRWGVEEAADQGSPRD